MYIMGMKGFNYYFSWFCRYFIVFAILHLIGAAIISRQLTTVPFYIPFIVFLLFDIVIIIQCFFIQVFLSRAKIGVVISLLFFLVQYILSFIAVSSDNPTIGVNSSMSIIPHVAFILAFQTMLYAESYQIPLKFSSNLNNYVVGYALVSFILNILVYMFLTWYLDQIIPNEWGAKKHPLFCCFSKQPPMTRDEKEARKRMLNQNQEYK